MRLSLAFVLLCLATLARASAQPQALFEIARRSIEGFDGKDWSTILASTWPDGYYFQVLHRETLRRHWRDVPMGGVHYRTTFGKPLIFIHGARAAIKVKYTVRTYFDLLESPRACDSGIYHFDLRRRRGEWRVLNLFARPERSPHRRCAV